MYVVDRFRDHIRPQGGFSIIEMIVAISIVSILVYAMAGLFEYAKKRQTIITINSTYQKIFDSMTESIQDRNAWTQTIRDQTLNVGAMDCLRLTDGTNPCANGAFSNFALFSPQLSLIFNGRDAAAGFTLSGVPCNSFTPPNPGPGDDENTGDDTCPISFIQRWYAFCSDGSATCGVPRVEVEIQALWNPGANLVGIAPNLNKFSAFGPGQRIIRGGEGVNHSIIAFEGITGNGPTGTCTPGQWVGRGINSDMNDLRLDMAGNATNVNCAGAFGNFGGVLLEPGDYECMAAVPAFGVDSYQVRMTVGGVVRAIGSSFAQRTMGQFWSQGTAVMTGRFSLANQGTLCIEMNCSRSSDINYDFGLPVPPYAPVSAPLYSAVANVQRLTTLSCTRTN